MIRQKWVGTFVIAPESVSGRKGADWYEPAPGKMFGSVTATDAK